VIRRGFVFSFSSRVWAVYFKNIQCFVCNLAKYYESKTKRHRPKILSGSQRRSQAKAKTHQNIKKVCWTSILTTEGCGIYLISSTCTHLNKRCEILGLHSQRMYSGVLNVLSFITNLYMSRQLIFFEAMRQLVDYVLLFRCSGFTNQIRLNFLETLLTSASRVM